MTTVNIVTSEGNVFESEMDAFEWHFEVKYYTIYSLEIRVTIIIFGTVRSIYGRQWVLILLSNIRDITSLSVRLCSSCLFQMFNKKA